MSQSRQTEQIDIYLNFGSRYHQQSIQNNTNHIQGKGYGILCHHPQNKLPTNNSISPPNQAHSKRIDPSPINQSPNNNLKAQISIRSRSNRQTNRQSKNKNVLKFLLKLTRDHIGKRNNEFQPECCDLLDEIRRYLRGIFAWNRQDRKRNNINFTHLRNIFQISSTKFPQLGTTALRREIQILLRRWLRVSVVGNGKCTNKQTYLCYLKIYQLRCRNRGTAQRMQ